MMTVLQSSVRSLISGTIYRATYSGFNLDGAVIECLLHFIDAHRFFVWEESCLEVDNTETDVLC